MTDFFVKMRTFPREVDQKQRRITEFIQANKKEGAPTEHYDDYTKSEYMEAHLRIAA